MEAAWSSEILLSSLHSITIKRWRQQSPQKPVS